MSECISCIKDAKTGVCRDIKDKTARASIEEVTNKVNEVVELVNNLPTGGGGSSCNCEEDIAALNTSVNDLATEVNKRVESLEGKDISGYSADRIYYSRRGASKFEDGTLNVSQERTANAVVQRKSDGGIVAGGITDDNYVAPVWYVKDVRDDINTDIENVKTRVTALEQNSGGSSVDLSEIEGDIDALETSVGTLSNNVSAQAVSIAAMENAVGILGADVSTNTTDIADIKTQLENLPTGGGSSSGGVSMTAEVFTDLSSLGTKLCTLVQAKRYCYLHLYHKNDSSFPSIKEVKFNTSISYSTYSQQFGYKYNHTIFHVTDCGNGYCTLYSGQDRLDIFSSIPDACSLMRFASGVTDSGAWFSKGSMNFNDLVVGNYITMTLYYI